MEDRRERNGRMSVPQFGSWETQGGGRGGGGPNPADGYTMVFTKARADRKEQKTKTVPAHIANASENNEPPPKPHNNHNGRRRHHHHHHHHHHRQGTESHSQQLGQDEASGKRNILTCWNCCIRP